MKKSKIDFQGWILRSLQILSYRYSGFEENNFNIESFPSSEATVPKDWGAKSLGGVRTPGTRCVGWA